MDCLVNPASFEGSISSCHLIPAVLERSVCNIWGARHTVDRQVIGYVVPTYITNHDSFLWGTVNAPQSFQEEGFLWLPHHSCFGVCCIFQPSYKRSRSQSHAIFFLEVSGFMYSYKRSTIQNQPKERMKEKAQKLM